MHRKFSVKSFLPEFYVNLKRHTFFYLSVEFSVKIIVDQQSDEVLEDEVEVGMVKHLYHLSSACKLQGNFHM